MAKLNNKQKLNIIAEHQNGKSLAELSKVYGVSKTAISKILNKPESLQKFTKSLQQEQEQTLVEHKKHITIQQIKCLALTNGRHF